MPSRPSNVSVILSTYNMPTWLEKSLYGYAAQTHQAFEVVIADDGSGDETAATIEKVRSETGLQIRRVWHPDNGFQKCEILNRAIASCEGDYLIFSDGDCIPRKDFVDWHVKLARPNHFLSGGYYKLPMSTSELIQREHIQSGDAFSVKWLRSKGLPFSHRLLRLNSYGWRARLLNHLTTTKATWNGHNASGWMSDIVAANGFDRRMKYGGEDRELGERLFNAGLKSIQIRYQAVCLHLDHPRGYVNDSDLAANRKIRDETQQNRAVQTDHGIDQL